MTAKHQIVVSAENNPYTAWQCKLFYFSCVSRLHQAPIVIVHDSGDDWHPGFRDLVKSGCAVHPAPNYRCSGAGEIYYPRNTAGTLLHAAEICRNQAELIVLCDSDMIFAGPMSFPEELSGDFCSYLNYERDFVADARRKLSITRELLGAEKKSLRCGVPYVIPAVLARELAAAWLEAVDAFSPRRWEDIMYAFGLATIKLNLRVNLTHMAEHNYWPHEKLTKPMIHYCYGDQSWSKRDYFTDEQVRLVWEPRVEGRQGTIIGEVLTQIREAREFYRDPFATR